MARVQQIAKARAIAAGIGRSIGVEPDLDIRDDYVRLYYSENKKQAASEAWTQFLNSVDKGDVRVDFTPELIPGLIQKYWLTALLGSALVYVVSR